VTTRAADPRAGEEVGREELAAVRQAAERILAPLFGSIRAGVPVADDAAVTAARTALAESGLADVALPLPVRVEVALVAGGAGSGLGVSVLELGEDPGDLLSAALAVGCGRAALRLGLAYAQQREAFGRPLAGFQVQRHAFARAAAHLMAAGALIRRAVESGNELDCAAALPTACQACWEAAETALQVHGGYGYIDEFPISRLWLDAARLRASVPAECAGAGGAHRRGVGLIAPAGGRADRSPAQ